MIISAHQPHFFPWLGYLDKIMQCDIFVILDTCQFRYHYYQNRVKIKTSGGEQWITVPVEKNESIIKDVRISGDHWKKKMIKTLEMNYSKTPYFKDYWNRVKKIINKKRSLLEYLDIDTICFFKNVLDMDVPIVLSSELDVVGVKDDWILNVCKKLKADIYLSGINDKKYINEQSFLDFGIEVIYQEFEHPYYPQLYGDFIEGLSGLDALFNVGAEGVKRLLRS